jgi:hypothetical protein
MVYYHKIYTSTNGSTNERESRGQVIASIKRAAKRYSDYRYVVNSQSSKIK